jgi:signal transduction histidine kinase
MKMRSLHARLVTGVTIWSIGIIVAAAALGMTVVKFHPRQGMVVHNGFLALAGAVLVTAAVSVMRRGLSPLHLLQERLAAIRGGRMARLEGDYPTEVAPLVQDLNELLEERDRRVSRAAARAGDLAHGLKTPLAIISQDAERLASSGHTQLAHSIATQIDQMRRHIDWHLLQARATASAAGFSSRASVGESVRALMRTMERLYAERSIALSFETLTGGDAGAGTALEPVVRVPVEDLEEMLGNLLDNACKWTRSRVIITAGVAPDSVIIAVDDDGPGLNVALRDKVLLRGVRGDEAGGGSGLGLAIVRELADAYGGRLSLEDSTLGGLCARLDLPRLQ